MKRPMPDVNWGYGGTEYDVPLTGPQVLRNAIQEMRDGHWPWVVETVEYDGFHTPATPGLTPDALVQIVAEHGGTGVHFELFAQKPPEWVIRNEPRLDRYSVKVRVTLERG